MAETMSCSGDEYTDDDEDGEELDPRVHVSFIITLYVDISRSGNACQPQSVTIIKQSSVHVVPYCRMNLRD